MAGLVRGIEVEAEACPPVRAMHETWWARRAAPLPTHDDGESEPRSYLLPGSEIMPLATSRFQMNSTTSAPMVAVMKPAP